MKCELGGRLKILGVALAVAVLALGWIWPAYLPQTILMALAVWLVALNFARSGRGKKTEPVKVDIKQ
jgi:hypothetical protein